MTANVISVIKYILKNYPHQSELSASRLTKMLYLADWKSAIDNRKQLTNTKWYYHHYGPYVEDFVEMAKKDPHIEISSELNSYGSQKRIFKLKESGNESIDLDESYKGIVDFVISTTKSKSYKDFIKLVYSTYPVVTSEKYTDLDLVAKAGEYREKIKNMDDVDE